MRVEIRRSRLESLELGYADDLIGPARVRDGEDVDRPLALRAGVAVAEPVAAEEALLVDEDEPPQAATNMVSAANAPRADSFRFI